MKKSFMVSMVAAGMALASVFTGATANAGDYAYHIACYDGSSLKWTHVTHQYSEATFYARKCTGQGYDPKMTVLL